MTTTPAEQGEHSRLNGWRAHKGPDDWTHDLATTNRRALAAISARAYGLPVPKWGKHSA